MNKYRVILKSGAAFDVVAEGIVKSESNPLGWAFHNPATAHILVWTEFAAVVLIEVVDRPTQAEEPPIIAAETIVNKSNKRKKQ